MNACLLYVMLWQDAMSPWCTEMSELRVELAKAHYIYIVEFGG